MDTEPPKWRSLIAGTSSARCRTVLAVLAISLVYTLIAGCQKAGDPSLSQRLLDARKPNLTPSQYLHPPLSSGSAQGLKPTLLLFIHGIFGDTVGSWRHENGGGLDTLLRSLPEFSKDMDAFAFGYPSSSLRAGSFGIAEAARALKTEFDFQGFAGKYDQVIVVGHSMGGLVAIEALTTYLPLREKVSLIVTYATPYDGAQVSALGDKLIQNRALSDMVTKDTGNSFLTSLGNRWKTERTKSVRTIKVICAYETVPFPSIGLIVPQTSGTALCDEPADPIAEDHIGIIKPNSVTHQSFKVLVNAIRSVRMLTIVMPSSAPQSAITNWFSLIDAADYEGAWNSSAKASKATYDKVDVIGVFTTQRKPLGAVQKRTIVGTQSSNILPNGTKGIFRYYTYRTKFSSGDEMMEGILLTAEESEWKVWDHNIGKVP